MILLVYVSRVGKNDYLNMLVLTCDCDTLEKCCEFLTGKMGLKCNQTGRMKMKRLYGVTNK